MACAADIPNRVRGGSEGSEVCAARRYEGHGLSQPDATAAEHDNTSTDKLLYIRDEAAAMLSISLPTLDRLTKRGEIHPTRVGRRVCFCQYELETFSGRRTRWVTQ